MTDSTDSRLPAPYPPVLFPMRRDWLLFGFLIYWMTTAAIGPLAVTDHDAKSVQMSGLWAVVTPLLRLVIATVGYLTLRWWTFALERRTLRSTLLLPLLVLAGAGIATVVAIPAGLAFFGACIGIWGDAPLGQSPSLIASALPTLVVFASVYAIPVTTVGFGLWCSERLAVRLIGGTARPQSWRLLGAHITGAAALGLLAFGTSPVLIIPDEGANRLPETHALLLLSRLVFDQVAVLPYLWLTWRAWSWPGAKQAAPGAARVPFGVTLAILYALGVARRVDVGLDRSTALMWPADYLSYLLHLVAGVTG